MPAHCLRLFKVHRHRGSVWNKILQLQSQQIAEGILCRLTIVDKYRFWIMTRSWDGGVGWNGCEFKSKKLCKFVHFLLQQSNISIDFTSLHIRLFTAKSFQFLANHFPFSRRKNLLQFSALANIHCCEYPIKNCPKTVKALRSFSHNRSANKFKYHKNKKIPLQDRK